MLPTQHDGTLQTEKPCVITDSREKELLVIVGLVSIASCYMHGTPLAFLILLLTRPDPAEFIRFDRNIFWVAYLQVIIINCRKLMCLISNSLDISFISL